MQQAYVSDAGVTVQRATVQAVTYYTCIYASIYYAYIDCLSCLGYRGEAEGSEAELPPRQPPQAS